MVAFLRECWNTGGRLARFLAIAHLVLVSLAVLLSAFVVYNDFAGDGKIGHAGFDVLNLIGFVDISALIIAFPLEWAVSKLPVSWETLKICYFACMSLSLLMVGTIQWFIVGAAIHWTARGMESMRSKK